MRETALITSQKQPMIWLALTQTLTSAPSFSTSNLLAALSDSETEKYRRIKHPLRKNEFLASRFFIQQALKQCSAFTEQVSISDLCATNSGRLIFNGQDDINISLSHSQGYLALALSAIPLGIDIECCSPRRVSLDAAELFMHSDELAYFKQLSSDQQVQFFYRIWSAKEAYFKALEDDQQGPFTSQDFSLLPYLTQPKESVTQTQDGNFWLLQPIQLQQLFDDKTAVTLSVFTPADSKYHRTAPRVTKGIEERTTKKVVMTPLTLKESVRN